MILNWAIKETNNFEQCEKTKEHAILINPSLQLTDGSTIRSNDPSAMLVGDSIAIPPGMTSPFLALGQIVKATFSFVDPTTGQQTVVGSKVS